MTDTASGQMKRGRQTEPCPYKRGEIKMDETVNTPFHKDRDIMELMEMLKSFKDKDGLSRLNEAVEYVESLENVLAGIGQQLNDMQSELNAVREQNEYLTAKADRTVKDALTEQVGRAQERLLELKEKAAEIRADIRQKAHEIVEDVKHTGRKALKKLTEFFHIREGLNKVRDKADKMLGDLESLSAKVEEYTGQEHKKMQERTSYGEEPVGTYQQEMQRFLNNCVAEGKEYGSNAEAYEAFKNYYDKRMKAQGQSGTQMPLARATDKKIR